eukprot:4843969-Pyramimonas_sp.AAC.2
MFCLGDGRYYLIIGDTSGNGWHGGHMTMQLSDTNTPLCPQLSVPDGWFTSVCAFQLPYVSTVTTVLDIQGATTLELEEKQSDFLNTITTILL